MPKFSLGDSDENLSHMEGPARTGEYGAPYPDEGQETGQNSAKKGRPGGGGMSTSVKDKSDNASVSVIFHDDTINLQPVYKDIYKRRNNIITYNKPHPRFNKKRAYLREYELDVQALMDDFKKKFSNKRIEFKKQITTVDLVFLVYLEIICNGEDELEFKIEPSIYEENSTPEQIARYDNYSFKQVKLLEQNFLKLLTEISIIDKLLPIDSIYSIGNFIDIIEKFFMPSMIIRIDDTSNLIKLAVWPFGIDITYESDT